MIFLTVGTQLPFDRLTRAVDAWCAETGREVFGQIADLPAKGFRPRHFPWVAHLPPEAFDARLSAAPFIIGHAGMGSIITALVHAKPIVILPRRAELGEQRNDHQLASARQFEGRPGVHVAWRAGDLPGLLDDMCSVSGAPAAAASRFADPGLISALREEIMS